MTELVLQKLVTGHFAVSHRKDDIAMFYWIVTVFFAFLLSLPIKNN